MLTESIPVAWVNPLLKDFPVNQEDIKKNFDDVIENCSFEIFLKKGWYDLGEVNTRLIQQYKIHIERELLEPLWEIMTHCFGRPEIKYSDSDYAEYNARHMSLVHYQNTLLARHISLIEQQLHESSNIVETTKWMTSTITW